MMSAQALRPASKMPIDVCVDLHQSAQSLRSHVAGSYHQHQPAKVCNVFLLVKHLVFPENFA